MLVIAFAALVTYVAPDGVFIDEGAATGVRVGDTLRIGKETLKVVRVASNSSRTGAPSSPFAIRRGAKITWIKRGAPPASAPATPKPRPPHPPQVAAGEALWSGVQSSWAAPRPTPRREAAPREAKSVRITGVLGLRGTLQRFDGDTEGRASLYSRLDVRGEQLWYAHDVRGIFDGYADPRFAPPLLQVDRLEVGRDGARWRARAGRVRLGVPLAAGALDGAAVGLASVQLFAGLAPDPWKMVPGLDRPQVGLSTRHAFRLGPMDAVADATALVTAWKGSLDRAALAPNLSLSTRRLRVVARAEIDAYPTRTLADRGAVDASRLYASARLTLTDWLDGSARYDRYRAPHIMSMIQGDAPYTTEARQTGWADLRLRAGAFGTVRVSGGVQDDPRGTAWVPGVDYSLPILDGLETRLSWFRRAAPNDALDHLRGQVVLRLDTAWPAEFDLGGQMVDLRFYDRAEDDETELSGLLGVWLATPAGFDVRLSAEATAARLPRTVAFADLRWRFGR